MQRRQLRHLSFVFPIYNEIESLPYLREALMAWQLTKPQLKVEIVLIDDGSKDGSLAFLQQWAAADAQVRVIVFSRNFGHQAAVTAGLEHALGEAVVIMDADLQDPLSAVDAMISEYEAGFEIVYGQRVSRAGEGGFKKLAAWLFYRLLQRSHSSLPLDTGDFRLVSRVCVDAINALPEKNRFLRGLFAWVGFPQIGVRYTRDARRYGSSKYPLWKMLRFAWQGITAFSLAPIRFVTVLGFTAALLSFFYLCYALFAHFQGHTVEGWTTIVVLQTFLGGCILLAIGIVGEYIGKIVQEVKARPIYIKYQEFSRHTTFTKTKDLTADDNVDEDVH